MLGLLAAGVLILVPLGVAWCLTRAFLLAKRKPRRLPVLPAEFGLAEPQLYNIVSDSSKPPAQRTRVAVVGSGPAGCMAAWLLAAAGRDVTVIEAHGDVGGRMRTVRTPHGKWIVQVEAGADSYTRGSTLTAHLVQKLQLGRDEGEVDGRTRFFLPASNTTEAGSLRRATFNPAFFVSMLTAPLSWANRFRLAMYWFRINLSRQAVDWYGPLGHVGRDTASSALAEAQKRLGGDVAARVVTPLLRTLLYADPSAASAGWVEALIGSELLTDRLTLEGGMDSLCRELLGLRVPGWRDDETSDTDVGTIGGTGPREASDGDSHKGTAAAAAASAGEGGAGAGDSSHTSTPAPPRTQQEEAELDLRSRFPNVQVRANCRVLTAARVKGSARLRLELLSSKRGGTLNCGDFVPPEDHLREPERSTLEVDEIVIATPAPVAAGIVKGLPKGTIPEPVHELLTYVAQSGCFACCVVPTLRVQVCDVQAGATRVLSRCPDEVQERPAARPHHAAPAGARGHNCLRGTPVRSAWHACSAWLRDDPRRVQHTGVCTLAGPGGPPYSFPSRSQARGSWWRAVPACHALDSPAWGGAAGVASGVCGRALATRRVRPRRRVVWVAPRHTAACAGVQRVRQCVGSVCVPEATCGIRGRLLGRSWLR